MRIIGFHRDIVKHPDGLWIRFRNGNEFKLDYCLEMFKTLKRRFNRRRWRNINKTININESNKRR